MTLTKRDRRALVLLAAAAVVIFIAWFALAEPEAPPVVAAQDSIPLAEKRLARVRQLAATVPARQESLKTVTAQLAQREKGLIQADTLAQAQAQLLQVVRRVAGAQSPPIEFRTLELGQARPLGEDYGEISVPLSFDCRIEQLINLLADITAQPELLASSELRVSAADQKNKTINVRLAVSGVVPRRLVPAKKGLSLR